jgi:hypothetical protein
MTAQQRRQKKFSLFSRDKICDILSEKVRITAAQLELISSLTVSYSSHLLPWRFRKIRVKSRPAKTGTRARAYPFHFFPPVTDSEWESDQPTDVIEERQCSPVTSGRRDQA